jgi:hypothetical protein
MKKIYIANMAYFVVNRLKQVLNRLKTNCWPGEKIKGQISHLSFPLNQL